MQDALSLLRLRHKFDGGVAERDMQNALSRLRPHGVSNFKKSRFGSQHDGGYILIDDFEGIDTAFSFGIGSDCRWDEDVANKGVTVYQFDHTIDNSPVTDNPRLIFAKKKISGRPDFDTESLISLVALHDKRDSRPNILVKMDIEHDEWMTFDLTPSDTLARFAQIVVEFHLINDLFDSHWRKLYASVFRKIADYYAVVHVHANNGGPLIYIGNLMVPCVFEVTFANRDIYSFIDSDEAFPGPLDAPNNPHLPDIYLGRFRF